MVAVRLVPAVFAATLYPTEPVPDPDAPLVTVTHEALLLEVQVHPASVVTVKVEDPPLDVSDVDVGDSEYVHDAPACVTVKV